MRVALTAPPPPGAQILVYEPDTAVTADDGFARGSDVMNLDDDPPWSKNLLRKLGEAPLNKCGLPMVPALRRGDALAQRPGGRGR